MAEPVFPMRSLNRIVGLPFTADERSKALLQGWLDTVMRWITTRAIWAIPSPLHQNKLNGRLSQLNVQRRHIQHVPATSAQST